jgi:glutamate racemase
VAHNPLSAQPADQGASAPIGIFDSGVGGLSVAMEIARQMPRERLVYFADSARAPWGMRGPEELRALAAAITRFLLGQGAKMIVVACNTASVHALAHLRETFPGTPFVGVVPAVKPAALATRTGRIAVMSTAATAQGQALADMVADFAGPVGVEAVLAVPAGLVEKVERGELETPETLALLDVTLAPLLAAGVDTLVLGCTHFPFLHRAVEQVSGGRMHLIDPGPAIARQCGRVLIDRGIAARAGQTGGLATMLLYTSGDAGCVGETVKRLTGSPVNARHADPVGTVG